MQDLNPDKSQLLPLIINEKLVEGKFDFGPTMWRVWVDGLSAFADPSPRSCLLGTKVAQLAGNSSAHQATRRKRTLRIGEQSGGTREEHKEKGQPRRAGLKQS